MFGNPFPRGRDARGQQLSLLGVRAVRTIGVATAGGCKNFFAGRNDDRFGLPRIIVFDTRDQSGIDVIMFAKPDKHR